MESDGVVLAAASDVIDAIVRHTRRAELSAHRAAKVYVGFVSVR
jgi:hypothetical protein